MYTCRKIGVSKLGSSNSTVESLSYWVCIRSRKIGVSKLGFSRIQPDSAGFSRSQPDSAGFSRIQPDSAGFSRSQPDLARFSQIWHDSAGLRRILPDSVGLSQIQPDFGRHFYSKLVGSNFVGHILLETFLWLNFLGWTFCCLSRNLWPNFNPPSPVAPAATPHHLFLYLVWTWTIHCLDNYCIIRQNFENISLKAWFVSVWLTTKEDARK